MSITKEKYLKKLFLKETPDLKKSLREHMKTKRQTELLNEFDSNKYGELQN